MHTHSTLLMRHTVLAMLIVWLCALAAAPHASAARFHPCTVQRILVEEALRDAEVPPALVLAVARVGSDFEPYITSYGGARGVMQILPATAEEEFEVSAAELWDPRTNARAGIALLKKLYHHYGERWDLALSHYDGGPLQKQDGRYAPHGHTSEYVTDVMTWWRRYQHDAVVAGLVHEVQSGRSHCTMRSAGTAWSVRDCAPSDAGAWRFKRDWRGYSAAPAPWRTGTQRWRDWRGGLAVGSDAPCAERTPLATGPGRVRWESVTGAGSTPADRFR